MCPLSDDLPDPFGLSKKYQKLKGGEVPKDEDEVAKGRFSKAKKIHFDFILPRIKNIPPNAAKLSRAEIANMLKIKPAAMMMVQQFANEHDLKINEIDHKAGIVSMSAPISNIEKAFKVTMQKFEHENGEYFSYEGSLNLPKELADIIISVTGLHDRPVIQPYVSKAPAKKKAGNATTTKKTTKSKTKSSVNSSKSKKSSSKAKKSTSKSAAKEAATKANGKTSHNSNKKASNDMQMPMMFRGTPVDLAKLYGLNEPDLTGKGQTIALIQLGGGYLKDDIDTYFKEYGLETPELKVVSVNGGQNKPESPFDLKTKEVYSNIYMAGHIAPKAKIVSYFTKTNQLSQLVDAFAAAVWDTENEPTIISCSWGGSERDWDQQHINAMERYLKDAKDLGITVFIAAGNGGASDNNPGLNVQYPASSPYVTSNGGLYTEIDMISRKLLKEEAWFRQPNTPKGGSGGGQSIHFDMPEYQASTFRSTGKFMLGKKAVEYDRDCGLGVPDLSLAPGLFRYHLFGTWSDIGGTSCGAPLMAGIMALANEKAGKNLGYINEALYKGFNADTSTLFQNITEGHNGAFLASKGWDACTGLGRPKLENFIDYLIKELG